ncbi:hypothetical protein ASE36_12195 [Rhizobium sp. Root274]|uniref:hypothetical protein n=1 Tax=unclassified Rhizobium TaxID=2613769 RepID=UPI0007141024|nr:MULTISPECIES: hypothetical protein [unclassified Rhizobium]KQW29207.1 hypothetical protein ASC71_12215 [Rhizobium sp. Root1240]KRD29403.1 hypothetical protein ASE36_12195 [Rhizobium sp. Root274]
MTHLDDEQDEKPLDPAMENVRRKMIKLQLVSGGIMAVLFLAVLVAIGYKLTRDDGRSVPATATVAQPFAVPSGQPLSLTADLPAGFRVLSTSLSGSQMLILGEAGGVKKTLVYDLTLGRIIADVTLSEK